MVRVYKKSKKKSDSTDLSLLVTSPTEGIITEWDINKMIEAIMIETGLEEKVSKKIAKDVEAKIFATDIKNVSTGTIRSIVDDILFEKGYNLKLKRQQVLGVPTYDLEQLIFSKTSENSNIPSNNPEAINLAISEITLKQYALQNIFSKEVAEAHLSGVIHIHDLGFIDRCYCSSHSLEALKKWGLQLENLSTSSKPAKYARTLTGHLNTFLSVIQAYFAGALGIGFVNIFYAPFLTDMSYEEIKQEVQYLVFSGSQNAFSRGGQSLFLDYNLHFGIPSFLKDVPVIGPGGEYLDKTYKDFEKEAQLFTKAFIEICIEGDKNGRPFAFPKADVHIDEDTFRDEKQKELFMLTCKAASINGSPYFIFDRGGEAILSQCCRLRTKIEDKEVLNHPESIRFCGFQNITINLPQAAYRAKGDIDKTLEEIDWAMDLAMKTHLQKKKFISWLMETDLPLWQLGKMYHDGKPYVDLEKATYIIGMIGLNECVQYITGKQLHESQDSYKLGLKIISAMYLKTKKLEKENKLKVALEESPAESAAYRLAKVDLQKYPQSKGYVRGNIEEDEVYYCNSIHFAPDASINIIDRIIGQAKFNPMIESGAITHVFLGEQLPDYLSVANLVEKVYKETQCAQLVFSPEFSYCEDCGKTWRGYKRD